jgi:hypothetical protein
MFVCMFVMYACYVCMYVCMYAVLMSKSLRVCIYVCMYVCMYAYFVHHHRVAHRLCPVTTWAYCMLLFKNYVCLYCMHEGMHENMATFSSFITQS